MYHTRFAKKNSAIYLPVGKVYFTLETSDNSATPSVVNIDSELLCVRGGNDGAGEVIPPIPTDQVLLAATQKIVRIFRDFFCSLP